MSALAIGIGNPLRSDDGFGPAVVSALSARGRADLSLLVVHQLTPELAERLRGVDRVAFIDADVEHAPGRRVVTEVDPSPAGLRVAHALDPAALLGLTVGLYGRAPEGRAYSVGAVELGFGEGLSAPVLGQVAVTVEAISRWAAGSRSLF